MAAKVRVTAEQFADKQASRLKSSMEDMRRGVEAVSESPTEKAAAKADKMLAGIQESVNTGKWQASLRRVTLESWKAQMINKGLPRVSQGIDASRSKVVSFARQLIEHENSLLGEVNRLPDLTLQDSINRMVAWTNGMAKFKMS